MLLNQLSSSLQQLLKVALNTITLRWVIFLYSC